MNAVDLFAGLGGFSEGARQAGCSVVWAANHWPAAVAMHARNHPETDHACQDLHQCDWTTVPAHDLLLASPACQGHTRARGKERPHHDATRSTAWAVVSAAECHRPSVIVVENVPEFERWELFPAWCASMITLGYSFSSNILDAADYGVPQHRRRLFMVMTRSQAPLTLMLDTSDHISASTFIDLGGGRWSRINKPGRAEATLARIAAGRRQHGRRFLISYYGNTKDGRSLARPIGTITTRDRWAVIDGDRMRMLTVDENRQAMGFPVSYHLPKRAKDATFMLGNAVCPPLVRRIIKAVRAQA